LLSAFFVQFLSYNVAPAHKNEVYLNSNEISV